MNPLAPSWNLLALLAPVLMVVAMALTGLARGRLDRMWRVTVGVHLLASAAAALHLGVQLVQLGSAGWQGATLPGLAAGLTGAWLALLVQGLGAVIAAFSSRYLAGEPRQVMYAVVLSGVLAAVHLLLLADHWLVLIVAWAAVGFALNQLLCFYGDRPFATLAAHKKFLADRLADACLIGAAWLASQAVGSGSISALLRHVELNGADTTLQWSAVLLALAVAIRTALLPLHGWLIQVMEAPTPVSALLHAGVVNLGGYVLIRFAPLFEATPAARTVLVVLGLASAMLAGFVMLTRISIKVRLAWSTLAQMGFMVLECGLGLYQLAALHLIGHSLYKAHAFLSSGDAVRQAHLHDLRGPLHAVPLASLALAPLLSALLVIGLAQGLAVSETPAWPWWWSAVLALAWAPLLWVRGAAGTSSAVGLQLLRGSAMVVVLTALALAGHALPLGVANLPHHDHGDVALLVMLLIYLCTAALQQPGGAPWLEAFRRQSYAGFYLDEAATRLALRVWPVRISTPRK